MLIGELSTRGTQFRTHWADRDVHEHRTGTKTYRHPDIGALELTSSNCQATPACSSPLLRPERNTDRRQPLTAHQLDRKTDP